VPCYGNKDSHCCSINGSDCPHLEENTVEGRRWVCGLRRKLGDWDKVLVSPEYLADVAGKFRHPDTNCRDWPDGTGANSANCTECGVVRK
jgi:hypothetical protein